MPINIMQRFSAVVLFGFWSQGDDSRHTVMEFSLTPQGWWKADQNSSRKAWSWALQMWCFKFIHSQWRSVNTHTSKLFLHT